MTRQKKTEKTEKELCYTLKKEKSWYRVEENTMGITESLQRALKQQKKQESYVFSEMELKEWPKEMVFCRELIEILQSSEKRGLLLTDLRVNANIKWSRIPGTNCRFALMYNDFEAEKIYLLLFDGETGEYRDIGPFDNGGARAVWHTKNNDLVILFNHTKKRTETALNTMTTTNTVICFGSDGTERWNFALETHALQTAQFIHSSGKGVITLFARGIDAMIKADSLIWQIDGETGELLRLCRLPFGYKVYDLIYISDMKAFVYLRADTQRLVILNENLEEIYNHSGYEGVRYVNAENICGERIWYNLIMDGYIGFYDLRTGTESRLKLETKVWPNAVLPDGRIFGINKKGNVLHAFDVEGKLLARFKVPGTIRRVFSDERRIYAVEVRPESIRAFTGEMVGEITHHLWQIDPVS